MSPVLPMESNNVLSGIFKGWETNIALNKYQDESSCAAECYPLWHSRGTARGVASCYHSSLSLERLHSPKTQIFLQKITFLLLQQAFDCFGSPSKTLIVLAAEQGWTKYVFSHDEQCSPLPMKCIWSGNCVFPILEKDEFVHFPHSERNAVCKALLSETMNQMLECLSSGALLIVLINFINQVSKV